MRPAVEPAAVLAFVTQLAQAPFRLVGQILPGAERVSPCPACQGDGSRLDVLDRVGRCDGGCGKVTGARLLDRALPPTPSPASDAGGGPAQAVTAHMEKAQLQP